MSDYKATLCKLTNLQKHPSADRLQIANALGYFVIVGLDVTEDDLGIVFPSDGKLSREMCMNNNLYRKNPMTNEPMGGFFEPKGRVKSLSLRGSKSEAFWTPISSLAWAGNVAVLEGAFEAATEIGELYQLDEFNCHKLCSKYYTPKTKKAMNSRKPQKLTRWQKIMVRVFNKHYDNRKPNYALGFARHFKTTKLREVVNFVQGTNTTFFVTFKVHGTSGRTGRVLWTKRTRKQNTLHKLGLYKDKYCYVTGTRKVVLDPDNMGTETGFYSGTRFRYTIHEDIMSRGLKNDEILYYEIAGYTDTGTLIMGEHPIDKDAMKKSGIPSKEYKQYGDKMRYTYGCEVGEYKVFVYRITQNGKDLPWYDMVDRCHELDMTPVPFAGMMSVSEDDTVEEIMNATEVYTRGNSVLDESHIKEGVCLRSENEDGSIRVLKYKGFLFCALEGIRKNSSDYIDLEEIS